jgi:hypothetical protein
MFSLVLVYSLSSCLQQFILETKGDNSYNVNVYIISLPPISIRAHISDNVPDCAALNGRTVSASGSRCTQTDIPELF